MSTAEATIRARIMGVREVTKGLSDVERGTDRVSRSSDSTTRAWGRARKAAGGLSSNLGSLAKGAVAFTGAFAAVQQVRASVTTTEDLGKSFLALRRTMGGSDKDVARWAGILKSRGIDVAKFNMSLAALGRNMLAAKDGTSDAAGMFRELGVSQARSGPRSCKGFSVAAPKPSGLCWWVARRLSVSSRRSWTSTASHPGFPVRRRRT